MSAWTTSNPSSADRMTRSVTCSHASKRSSALVLPYSRYRATSALKALSPVRSFQAASSRARFFRGFTAGECSLLDPRASVRRVMPLPAPLALDSDASIAGSTAGWESKPVQHRVATALIAIFVGALLLIELRRLGLLPFFEWLPSNHFHAVRLGFNLLLVVEVDRPGVRADRKPRAYARAAVRDPLPHPPPPEPQGAGPRIRAAEMGGPPPLRLADGRRRRGSRRRVRAGRPLLPAAERGGRGDRGAHPRALRRLEGGGRAGGAPDLPDPRRARGRAMRCSGRRERPRTTASSRRSTRCWSSPT